MLIFSQGRISTISDQLIFTSTALVLIFVGILSMIYSRNLIKTLISFQVVVFGANLALFSSGLGGALHLMADTLVFFSIVAGASVEAVGLALIVLVHKRYGTLDPWQIQKLKH